MPTATTYEENGVTLLELWHVLVKHKVMIIIIVSLVTALSAGMAFLMTPIYRAEVLMAPVEDRNSQGRLSSLVSQFGGLVSMAGVSLGGGSSKDQAIATLKSRAFTEEFIENQELLPVFFQDYWNSTERRWNVNDQEDIPSINKAYELFDTKIRDISEDRITGLITLSIEWNDREEAARWDNLMVERVNQRIRQQVVVEAQKSIEYLNKELKKTSIVELQQAIYRLIESQISTIMLANVRDEYSFKVLDPASVPDRDEFVKPKRAAMIAVGFLLGGFLAVFFAFFYNYLRQIAVVGSAKSA